MFRHGNNQAIFSVLETVLKALNLCHKDPKTPNFLIFLCSRMAGICVLEASSEGAPSGVATFKTAS
jgi:hypothetical protein